jgi:hypothetical protein
LSFADSVRAAFETEHAKGYAEKYLSEVLTNWRDAEKSTSRTSFILLLSCISVELIRQGAIKELSVSGVKVADLTILNAFLPVFIAYLYSSLLALAAECSVVETAFRHSFAHLQPELYKANFERVLYPANSTFSSSDLFRYAGGRKSGKLISVIGSARLLIILLYPIAYIVFYFWTLFAKVGYANVSFWISIVVSFALLIAAAISVFAAVEAE